tara:strand:- start:851 stop:1249 length:399 start_codon:yes stop_codon:yes gene_type:complete
MRKYAGTILILIIAAGFAWWSARAESRVSNHVQQEVERLVPLFQQDPTVINAIVANTILYPTLADSLEQVWTQSSEDVGFRVVVTRGDDEQHGDGTATHVALFQIDTETVAGLRIICLSDTDPLLITGAWIN